MWRSSGRKPQILREVRCAPPETPHGDLPQVRAGKSAESQILRGVWHIVAVTR